MQDIINIPEIKNLNRINESIYKVKLENLKQIKKVG